MRILIVESNSSLSALWRRHLERRGMDVDVASDEAQAYEALSTRTYALIILDVDLEAGNALAISDMAGYRQPLARVVFITSSSFFSDGSLFQLFPNACAYLHSATAPDDIADVATHYATA